MTDSRRRALMITPVIPAPSGMGLAMRAAAQLFGLAAEAETTVLALPLVGKVAAQQDFRTTFPDVKFQTIAINGREETSFALLSRLNDPAARLAAFRAYGKPSFAAALSLSVLNEIRAIVSSGKFDLIHIFRGYLSGVAQAIPASMCMSIDLDEDDHASWMSMARECQNGGDSVSAGWAKAQADASNRYLDVWTQRYRRAFAASQTDALRLTARHQGLHCMAIANGVSLPRRTTRTPEQGAIAFVG